jgi:hypothetical protein
VRSGVISRKTAFEEIWTDFPYPNFRLGMARSTGDSGAIGDRSQGAAGGIAVCGPQVTDLARRGNALRFQGVSPNAFRPDG